MKRAAKKKLTEPTLFDVQHGELLSYRSSPSGNLQAAYCGAVRIGYVEARAFGRWMWQLSLVTQGIEGLLSMGKCDSESDAKAELTATFARWLEAANLRHSNA